MRTSIRNFLSEHITSYDLQDDDDFFALGLANSLFAMQLVLFVEQEFDISIDGDDLGIAPKRNK
jgi:methoxymalonate biosynthesis acyl carrier protein